MFAPVLSIICHNSPLGVVINPLYVAFWLHGGGHFQIRSIPRVSLRLQRNLHISFELVIFVCQVLNTFYWENFNLLWTLFGLLPKLICSPRSQICLRGIIIPFGDCNALSNLCHGKSSLGWLRKKQTHARKKQQREDIPDGCACYHATDVNFFAHFINFWGQNNLCVLFTNHFRKPAMVPVTETSPAPARTTTGAVYTSSDRSLLMFLFNECKSCCANILLTFTIWSVCHVDIGFTSVFNTENTWKEVLFVLGATPHQISQWQFGYCSWSPGN